MPYTKKKIIVISDLEHSKPRIPNLLFHLNNDHYEKYIIGANSEANIFDGDYPEDFLDLVEEMRSQRARAYTEKDTPIITCVHKDFKSIKTLF